MAPGISFDVAPTALPVDPNRMDIAMFVGFLPLRRGGPAEAQRSRIAAGLAGAGWEARGAASGDTLLDLPVRVHGMGEVEAIFDTGGRPDRVARVRGLGLPETVRIDEGDTRFAVSVDGLLRVAELDPGPIAREALRSVLAGALDGVSVALDPADVQGRSALVLTRENGGEGSLTAYANPSVGFVTAQRDETRLTGCPTGVALRTFFAAGGREAVIVRMGDPIALFAREEERVAALRSLVGGGYGAGAAALSDLAGSPAPDLPGPYPTRDPWHGLAHLHGLEDVAMVLLPDLAELTATVPPVAAAAATPERPPERFTVCAPEPAVVFDGEARGGTPARAAAAGLEVWSRLAAWAAEQTTRITPEAMVVTAPPLPAEAASASHPLAGIVETGNAGRGLAHPQLQLGAPWLRCDEARDLPGRVCAPDGLLAGTIAARTLSDGAWRTIAGTRLDRGTGLHVTGLLGEDPTLTPETAPALSLIGRNRLGVAILSDRTTSAGSYGPAHIRRLVALVLRAARHRGETAVFDANGPLLWRDVAMALTTLLRRLHALGALRGAKESDAFSVLCGRETMHQSDIDAGRVIAEVTLRPAHALESIEISFIDRGGALAVREVAA